MSLRDYSKLYLSAYPELQDVLAVSTYSSVNSDGKEKKDNIYPPHLHIDQLQDGIKANKYFKGAIRVKRNDYNECYVMVRDPNDAEKRMAIHIQGRVNVNRAIDGDVVAVEILSKEEREREREAEGEGK